jgi:hypothetical protein
VLAIRDDGTCGADPAKGSGPQVHAGLNALSRPFDLRDARDDAFVVPDRAIAPGVHDRTFTLCDLAGFSPRVAVEVDDLALVPLLVASGAEIALVGSNVIDREHGGVRRGRGARGGGADVLLDGGARRGGRDTPGARVRRRALDVERAARIAGRRVLSAVG